jgi:hypothetical protein
MSSERRFQSAFGLLAAVLFGAACADFSRGPASPAADAGADTGGEGGPADGAVVSFAADVHPLLIASCQRCHSAGAEAGDTQLLLTGDADADYATVSRFVDTSAPAGSRLLSKASGNGHGGGTVFAAGSPEYQTVLDWIQQGAPP